MKGPFTPSAIAVVLATALATAGLAQTQPPPEGHRASPEVRARLLDGRMAMVKETLKLSDAQLKLWAPVEEQIRTNASKREKRREERAKRRQEGVAARPLPERLDLAAQRASQRAERLKAFNDVFTPFYASLNDEQKALSRIVLREVRGGQGSHGRWDRAPTQK
jgi:hypothetical protein